MPPSTEGVNALSFLRPTGPISYDEGKCVIFGPKGIIEFKDGDRRLFGFIVLLNGFVTLTRAYEVSDLRVTDSLSDMVRFCGELCDRGGLIERSMSWRIQYELESNPQPFPGMFSSTEILALTKSRNIAPTSSTTLPLSKLGHLLAKRRSCRDFDAKIDVDDAYLQRIASYAVHSEIKASASAGALYPITLHLITRNGEGWDHRHWIRDDNALSRSRSDICAAQQLKYALNSDTLMDAPAFFVLVANVRLQALKYSNRAYRFSVIECGQLAQVIALTATEIGLGSLEWGGYREQALQHVLAIETDELPLLVIAVGHERLNEPTLPSSSMNDTASNPMTPSIIREPSFGDLPAGFVVAQQSDSDRQVIATGLGWTTASAVDRCTGEYIERLALLQPTYDCYGSAHDLDLATYPVNQQWPDELQLFSSPSYQPFSKATSYQWIIGTTTDGSKMYVPSDLVYNHRRHGACAHPTSSGVAAHRIEHSAQLNALHELIERDAFVRAWLSALPPRDISNSREFKKFKRFILPSETQLRAHLFPAPVPTVGVAIISEQFPALSYGMATRYSIEAALDKAFLDAFATFVISAVSTQSIMVDRPSTPKEHLLYYQDPARIADIKWFFDGKVELAPPFRNDLLISTVYVRIPSPYDGWHVFRALNPNLKQIWFGDETCPPEAIGRIPHFFS